MRGIRARRTTYAALVASIFIAMSGGAALAQEQSVEELIDRGLDLREAGDDAGARVLLQRAYERDASPRASAQLGLVELALSDYVAAEVHLSEALLHHTDPWIEAHRAALETSREGASRHLGSIELVCSVAGASVEVSGVSRGVTPLAGPLRVEAGLVDLQLRASGHEPQTITLRVEPGQTLHQEITLHSIAPVAAAPVMTPVRPSTVVVSEAGSGVAVAEGGSAVTVMEQGAAPVLVEPRAQGGATILWSWVLLTTTLAAAVSTIGVGIATNEQYYRLEPCTGRCADPEVDELERLATGTNVMFGLTCALGIATVISFIVEGTARPSVDVALTPGGFQLRGSF